MKDEARTCPYCNLTVPTSQVMQHYLKYHPDELTQAVAGLEVLPIDGLGSITAGLSRIIKSASGVMRAWPSTAVPTSTGRRYVFTANYHGGDRLHYIGPRKQHPGWDLQALMYLSLMMTGANPLMDDWPETAARWRVSIDHGLIQIQLVEDEDEQPQGGASGRLSRGI